MRLLYLLQTPTNFEPLLTIERLLVDLSNAALRKLPQVISAIVIVAITRFAAASVQRFVGALARRAFDSKSLQLLLAKTSYITTWILGLLLAAIVLFPDLGLGDLFAFLGLGSVAIGFAFQDIFKNFLSGVLLLYQEPFRIGDQIVVDGYEGTVEDIALRATEIRTYQGELILIPNSIVFTSPVEVLTEQLCRRTDLAIGVDYNTPLPEAVETLSEAITGLEHILSDPEPSVDIVSFGASSIDFVVRYWTSPQKKEILRAQTKAIIALKAACDRAGINIPYPIRTVYQFNQKHYNDNMPKKNNGGANPNR